MDNSKIFNRKLLRKRRNRSAGKWDGYNFLKIEAAERLADCIADIAREFPLALDLGCHKGELANIIGDKSRIIGTDISENITPDIVCDEELLPFAENIFDLVASVLSLHNVNDLPGSLIQIKHILKPDGLFIAILPGANTLIELRNSVTGASAKHGFALSPMVSPFVEVRDAGALMQRAGFSLPVINSEIITVNYENALKLMNDLRGMGESNILYQQRSNLTPRSNIAAICDYYDSHFSSPEGGITATFEFITITGWKPHPSQQQAAKRGSGKINLNQVF